MASKSLHRRLIRQDLMGKGSSTFFRSVGAIQGHRPERGSLINKVNKRNFKFAGKDIPSIVLWLEKNFLVKWFELRTANIEEIEKHLIREYKPIINIQHNPNKIPELLNLSEECRCIALSRK